MSAFSVQRRNYLKYLIAGVGIIAAGAVGYSAYQSTNGVVTTSEPSTITTYYTQATVETRTQTQSPVERYLLSMNGTLNESMGEFIVNSQQFYTSAKALKVDFRMHANQQLIATFDWITIYARYFYGGEWVNAVPDIGLLHEEKWDFNNEFATTHYGPIRIPSNLLGTVPVEICVYLRLAEPTSRSNPSFLINWELQAYETEHVVQYARL